MNMRWTVMADPCTLTGQEGTHMNLRQLVPTLAVCSMVGAPLVGTGCAQPPDAAGHPELEQSGGPSPLARVTSAGVKVTFYSVPGPAGRPLIAVSEEGSAYAKNFVVAPLIAQSLTAQEMYLALAGPGAIPPQALVDAQGDQAAALGRDPAVRRVTIDRDALVEKDLQACQNFVFSGDLSSWVGNSSWVAGPSYTSSTCTQALDFDSASPVGIGACNDGTSTLSLAQIVFPDWDQGEALQNFITTINPGWYYAWYWWYSAPGSCSQQGNTCVGDCVSGAPGGFGCQAATLGATYYAEFFQCGASDLVSGIWTPNGPR
jgi:hypothetical protein